MRALPFLFVAAIGCSGGGALLVEGTLGQPLAGELRGNVLYVPTSVAKLAARPLAVDTGAPLIILDPKAFAELALPLGATHVSSIAFGALTVHDPPVLGLSPCGAMSCADGALDGLLGGNLLAQFATSFDYRAATLTLGPLTLPDAVESDGASASFSLEGDGDGLVLSQRVHYPSTRIVVDVTVEGELHPFIVDSGASLTVVRPALFTKLTADGRGVTSIGALTTMGLGSSQAARSRSLVLAGAEVRGVPVLSSPIDLDGLTAEIGHTVDGLVGGTFLREFLVTVDYPRRTLHLRRYATRAHISDEFQRLGFTLVTDGTGASRSYLAGGLFAGSDVANRAPGDFQGSHIVSVDGVVLDGLSPEAAERALHGTVGTQKDVAWISPSGTAQKMMFRVDEILPLP